MGALLSRAVDSPFERALLSQGSWLMSSVTETAWLMVYIGYGAVEPGSSSFSLFPAIKLRPAQGVRVGVVVASVEIYLCPLTALDASTSSSP